LLCNKRSTFFEAWMRYYRHLRENIRIVEQDECRDASFESVKASMDYLKIEKIGIVYLRSLQLNAGPFKDDYGRKFYFTST
jgi:hypothetical protein